ncbi:MAG: hypothetical protein ABJ246_13475 [Paracoccaceae bacterium]
MNSKPSHKSGTFLIAAPWLEPVDHPASMHSKYPIRSAFRQMKLDYAM